mmetsp:Transcript_35364/g.76280  ORF Transcript_35364/g.76280 Transcript_35364/m.76280 type:complete len:615 (-) Transcript_35364:803-2647(-)
MPKSCKGSHKFSCSFSIVDPSLHSPGDYININWFANNLGQLEMGFKIGDVVRCERLAFQIFNTFPQLVGKGDKSALEVFQKVENFATGLPAVVTGAGAALGDMSLELLPGWCVVSLGQPRTGDRPRMRAGARARSGRESTQKGSEILCREVRLSLSETALLQRVHGWGRSMLSLMTLADQTTYQASLHAVQTCLHSSTGSSTYAALQPAAMSEHNAAAFQKSLAHTGKCDVICLVMNVIQARNGETASMTIWDGTTNGEYRTAFSAHIRMSLEAPNEYTHDAEGDGEAQTSAEDRIRALERSILESAQMGAGVSAGVGVNVGVASSSGPEYLGSAVRIRAASAEQGAHITKCHVGMWVRIRNLHAVVSQRQGQGELKEASVHADTHVCQLSAYHKDVVFTACGYFRRLEEFYQAEQLLHQQRQQQIQQAQQRVEPQRPLASIIEGPISGDAITLLAMIRAGPAPAKYCTRARVVSFWPAQMEDFVLAGSTAGKGADAEDLLLFSLLVADSSDCCNVIFQGAEAELFLGTTLAEFASSPAVRADVKARLKRCQRGKTHFDVHCNVYLTKEEVVVSNEQLNRSPWHEAEHSYVRKTRRLLAFDTMCPVPKESAREL